MKLNNEIISEIISLQNMIQLHIQLHNFKEPQQKNNKKKCVEKKHKDKSMFFQIWKVRMFVSKYRK